MSSWPNRGCGGHNPFANVGEPQLLPLKDGGYTRNPYYDESADEPTGTDPRKPPKGWNPDEYKQVYCKDCGYVVADFACHEGQPPVPGVQAGDEYIDICPECHGCESFEVRTKSIFEED